VDGTLKQQQEQSNMSNYRGSKTVNSGCIFAIDSANYKSYNSGSAPDDVVNLVNNTATGSLQNGTSYTNGSWDFDGTDDYIEFGDLTQLNFTDVSTFTISFWVNSVGTEGVITNKMFFNNQGGWQFYHTGGRYIFTLRDGFTIVQPRTNTIKTDNIWYNVVATYDGSQTTAGAKIYVNGVIDTKDVAGDGVGVPNYNTATLELGKGGGAAIEAVLDGKISQLKIYNRALTADEVAQNYNTNKKRYGIK
jgi:hypothetical protein